METTTYVFESPVHFAFLSPPVAFPAKDRAGFPLPMTPGALEMIGPDQIRHALARFPVMAL